ncbi:MAG: hypothetical protein GY715_10485, partial [Planctomycetes bacterium]|nr:hypothetical protein [Planctomycetota bacterium]
GVDRSLLYTVDNPDLPDHRPQFGRALAAMGDIDNDCIGDFAVSSPFYGGGPYHGVGRAYIYSGVDGSLLFRVFMPNPEANSIPGTGGKFCNVGDVNGDWIDDLAIGAHLKDAMGNYDQGQAWIFSGLDGSVVWTLDNPFPQPIAHFGTAVECLGDVDGDLVPDVVVGAPIQTVDGTPRQGRGFVFSGATGQMISYFDHPFPQAGGPVGTLFPVGFCKVGDIDGNGADDFLTCALLQDRFGNTDQGQLYAFGLPDLCPADLDGTGMVDFADVLLVLAQWGPCPPDCVADITGDGEVNFADILAVLGGWGPCGV